MAKYKFKHDELVHQLREMVKGRKAGERLDNDRALSAKLGVSSGTLRTAMLDLVKEGLVVRRVGSGTFVAEREALKHIAIVVSQDIIYGHRVPNVHLAAMSIMDEFNHHRMPYKLYMIPSPSRDDDEYLWPESRHIEHSGLAAAIHDGEILALVSVAISRQNGWTEELEAEGVPVIGLSGDTSFKYQITTDVSQNIKSAVRYLARFGRKRIGLVSWHPANNQNEDPALIAFREEMDRVSMGVDMDLVRNDADPQHPASGWQLFREVWFTNSDKRPDALIFSDDRLFASAASSILEIGIKVPKDLQIVTLWNHRSGLLCPLSVARFSYNMVEIGPVVRELIDGCLEGGNMSPRQVILSAKWHTEGQYDPLLDDNFVDPYADDLNDASKVRGARKPGALKA